MNDQRFGVEPMERIFRKKKWLLYRDILQVIRLAK